MKRLLITGVSGLLGINLALEAIGKGYQVIGWTNSRQLKNLPFEQEAHNLAELSKVPGAVNKAQPDAIINCAAIANLDQAEKDPQAALTINSAAPLVLAEQAQRLGIPFVHISTDSVFDGKKGNYRESDSPNPLNTYAKSKHSAEIGLSENFSEALIARVVFYGWSIDGKRSLAEFFYNNLSQGKRVNGFTDSIFSPLYVRDLAGLLLEAMENDLHGICHFFSQESLSKADFGLAFAKRFGLDESLINRLETKDGDLKTKRPLNLSMNTELLQKALGHELPGVAEGLDHMYADYEKGLPEQLASYLS
jgi:dTDP-4-dehydrorhamnose reductase